MRKVLLALLLTLLPAVSLAQSVQTRNKEDIQAIVFDGNTDFLGMMMFFFPPSVDLTWVPSTSSGVTSQIIQRATTSGGPYTDLKTFPDNTTAAYTDLTVSNNTTYYYVAVAAVGTNRGGPSNQATAAINEPNAPTGFSAVPH